MQLSLPKWLTDFCQANSTPLYLVGGFVRNALASLPPSDMDIAGSVMPGSLVLSDGLYFAATYQRMGTALIKSRKDKAVEMEYTPFRRERYAEGGGHTPVEVSFNVDIKDDAMRRDFTVNSIYYDIRSGELIDFFDGQSDIKNKLIRAHDPEHVFSSDGLRLMRMVRIAAETGFDIHPQTYSEAKSRAAFLDDITITRKRDELLKILVADTKYGIADAHYRGLCLLRELGFLRYICPELADLDGLPQPPAYHKYDVLEHTFRVVRHSQPELRLAALFHDIGKGVTFARHGNFYAHDTQGAELVSRLLGQDGFKLPNKQVEKIRRLVRWHMFDKSSSTRSGKMRLFVAENQDIIADLDALITADQMGKGIGEVRPSRLPYFLDEFLSSGAPQSIGRMRISGTDLKAMGYESTEISAKLSALYRECVLNPELNKRKKLLKLARRE